MYKPIDCIDNGDSGMVDPMKRKMIGNDENDNLLHRSIYIDDDVESTLGTEQKRSAIAITKKIQEEDSSFAPIGNLYLNLPQQPIQQKSQRLRSLDVFRGLTVAVISFIYCLFCFVKVICG